MTAHDTPNGTTMMWNASVNAICDLAHGTGSTAAGKGVAARTSSAVTDADRRSRAGDSWNPVSFRRRYTPIHTGRPAACRHPPLWMRAPGWAAGAPDLVQNGTWRLRTPVVASDVRPQPLGSG